MSALEPQYLAILEKSLETGYVALLPPLLDLTRPADEKRKKNLSRAFSAFVLRSVCGSGIPESAKAVIDDFDDYGVDAIYYDAATETVYLIQSKLKTAEQF